MEYFLHAHKGTFLSHQEWYILPGKARELGKRLIRGS